MSNTIQGKPWSELLPDVYKWLDSVQIGGLKILKSEDYCVLLAQKVSGQIEVDGKHLSEKVCDEIREAASKLGWKGKGTLQVVAGDRPFLLVNKTKTKTSKAQVGRQIGLDIARAIRGITIKSLVFSAAENVSCLDVLEGLSDGFYKHEGLKAESKEKNEHKFPVSVSFLGTGTSDEDFNERIQMCKAIAFTRALQDSPANYIDPPKLADIAVEMAEQNGSKCSILSKQQIKELGMGSFLSVAEGSEIEPRMITIEIDGEDNSRCVALVGKGITFDSGGISLKQSVGMAGMKYDMSGGAIVLGAAHYLGRVKPPTKVICVVGATENLPSGTATKPGDVVTAINGKTIEVLNTDAEGRLVLADLLSHVETEYQPELIIDAATLTGAVLFALGSAGAGLMTNDQEAGEYVLKSASEAGEPLWQLPLWAELDKEVKGTVGDYKNIGKPTVKAGTIMAAVFLKQFVNKTKWVHLDIAGTATNCAATGFPRTGGSAFGVRTMVASCEGKKS